MNCTVCGNPLLFDRVAFHCSCDAFVHAYCWDEHVLQAHRPPFEMGTVNLDGEFVPRESKVEAPASQLQVSDATLAEAESTEEENVEESDAGEEASGEENQDKEPTPLLE